MNKNLCKSFLKKILVFAFCVALIIPQVSCKSNQQASDTEFMLDTYCTIEIREMSDGSPKKAIEKAFAKCTDYENMLSKTIEGSDIYKINHANGKPVTVNKETAELISKSLELCKESNGIFDVTIGAVTALWDFKSDDPKLPDNDKLATAVKTIGYKNVTVDGTSVQVSNPDTQLDLGATAKGYIADKLSAFLEDEGVTSGVVNLGGNIVTIGKKEDGSEWNIGIKTPDFAGSTSDSNSDEDSDESADSESIIGAIKMSNETVVTSGTYERHFVIDGKNYFHVLSTTTGYPQDTDIVSASIKSAEGNSMMCDGYSTICLLFGKEKAIQFMSDKKGYEYCFIDNDGKITQSDGFGLDATQK